MKSFLAMIHDGALFLFFLSVGLAGLFLGWRDEEEGEL